MMSFDDLMPSKLNDFGWGPDLEEVPDKYAEIPYNQFTKEDQGGKICDWYHKKKNYQQRNITSKNIFFYKAVKDDKFKQSARVITATVSNKPKKHVRGSDMKNKLKQQEKLQAQEEERKSDRRWNKHSKAFVTKAQKSKWNMNAPKKVETREIATFSVQSNWEKIEIFEFVALNKESLTLQSDPETLLTLGKVYPIQKPMEKINTKSKANLERRSDKAFKRMGTKDDPEIAKFAEQGEANVFAFDSVVSLLMSATRTVYSWDIAVRKEGGKLYFDKREDNSTFYNLHVNETAAEVPNNKDNENINGKLKLSEEATIIDRLFTIQSILPSPLPTDLSPFPFLNPSNDTPPCSYIYKVRDLGDDIKILIRSEVTGQTESDGEKENVTIHTLNEFDSRLTQWRQKLDGQRGSIFAKELLNNSSKIARWAAESYLADCSKLFLGFVGRQKDRDNQSHQILGTQYYKTVDLFRQLGMKISQMWAVIKIIIVACMEQEDGDYILIKEPNENKLVLYRVNTNKTN